MPVTPIGEYAEAVRGRGKEMEMLRKEDGTKEKDMQRRQ